MAKLKTAFVCGDCGAVYAKWQGQCNECGAWNTLSQLPVASTKSYAGVQSEMRSLADVATEEQSRLFSGLSELDRVLGGGFVAGSTILIGGNPGAGKSTLLLQVLCRVVADSPVLYVTGEESLGQVASRARRLGLPTDKAIVMA